MTVYLLYVTSPAIVWMLVSIFNTKAANYDKRKKNYIFFCGIIMALMIGLRYKGVGSSDTAFYYNNWEMMSQVSLSDLPRVLQRVDLEYGYQISVWLLSHIFRNGQWALILSGAFFSFSVCRFTYKNSKSPVVALTVFNCLGIFNFMVQGLRQAIAMSICLFAYEQCKNKKIIRFALLVTVASTFHASAAVFLLVYVLGMLKLNIKQFSIFAMLTAVGMKLLPYAIELMNMLINDDYGMDSASKSGGKVAILIYLVIVLFGLLFQDASDENYALFVYSTIVAAIAMLLRNSVSGIAERISFYFAFGEMIVLSNSIAALKEQKTRLIITVAAVMLCFGVAIYKASYSVLIPYTFFWQW